MSQVFAVTSGKGGVGKSTVSVGLAYAFLKLNKKVLLVDMDEGLRCLDLMLGVDKSAVFDLSDILMGKEIDDAVYKVDGANGLYLIPAPAQIGKIDAFAFSVFAENAAAHFRFSCGNGLFALRLFAERNAVFNGCGARSRFGKGRGCGKLKA